MKILLNPVLLFVADFNSLSCESDNKASKLFYWVICILYILNKDKLVKSC